MKLLSYAIAASRHFSSKAVGLKKKKVTRGGVKSFKKPRIEWTDEQKVVLDAACNGKSVFITGSAGTGKSFLLEHVINKLRRIHGRSSVYVTASTGVSACALNGQTLHSFAGIGLGQGELDSDSVLERVLEDRNASRRWRKVKALLIDEISMIPAELFELFEFIARSLRDDDDNKAWGGIQLIVSGDFFQLPPVIKGLKKKKGEKIYAFEANCWDASFDLQFELTTVFRQSNPLHVHLLQGIRKGRNKPEDLKILEGLCCGYEPDPSSVRLYPRTEDVNRVNKEKMDSLGKNIYVYRADDLGEEHWVKQLKMGIVPDELEICEGARVMLTKNISPWRKLVNGATGTVVDMVTVSKKQYGMQDMCPGGSVLPLVKLDSGPVVVVEPETWVVMDGDKVVARRRQIPLILAWALSIHKSQGMTIDKLDTDLSRVFDFGMVYVTLSRVRSLAGLSLSGLDPSKIKAHPKVLEFYDRFNNGQVENKKVLTVDEVENKQVSTVGEVDALNSLSCSGKAITCSREKKFISVSSLLRR